MGANLWIGRQGESVFALLPRADVPPLSQHLTVVVRFPWPAGYSQDAVSVAAAGPLDKDSEFAISCSILQFICGTQFSEQSLPHAKFPPGVLRVWLLSSASALAHPPSARLAGGVRRREVVCLRDDDLVGMGFSNKMKFPSPKIAMLFCKILLFA